MLRASELPWQELHGNLRAFVARRVRNQADVDDLVQRVLLQIVKGLGTLRDADRVHAWMYRTARNAIVDYYRSPASRREITGVTEDFDQVEAVAAGEPFHEDERAALRELSACLTPMLDRLPAAQREAVQLIDLDGLSQSTAAERAGVSLSGMKSRVQRGRQQLRSVLEECCRIELDQRRAISSFATRRPDACGCNDCGES